MEALLIERRCRAALAGTDLETAVAIEPVPPDDRPELLSPPERADLAALRAPKRRAERLAGRAAARRAALQLLGPGRSAAVECRSSAAGAPQIVVAGVVARDVALTISHAGGVAGALAARRASIGLDIEPVAAVEAALARRAFTEPERAWVAAASSAAEATRRALRLWTAKEAVLKALRVGLRWPPAWVEVDPEAGRASARGAVFSIHTVVMPGHVVTIAIGSG